MNIDDLFFEILIGASLIIVVLITVIIVGSTRKQIYGYQVILWITFSQSIVYVVLLPIFSSEYSFHRCIISNCFEMIVVVACEALTISVYRGLTQKPSLTHLHILGASIFAMMTQLPPAILNQYEKNAEEKFNGFCNMEFLSISYYVQLFFLGIFQLIALFFCLKIIRLKNTNVQADPLVFIFQLIIFTYLIIHAVLLVTVWLEVFGLLVLGIVYFTVLLHIFFPNKQIQRTTSVRDSLDINTRKTDIEPHHPSTEVVYSDSLKDYDIKQNVSSFISQEII